MTIWTPSLAGRKGPRYRAIADALADDLAEGRVKPGERLPTHRDLADQLGVTVGTVSRAYAEAAGRGLAAGEVGRGTFATGPAAGYVPLGGAVARVAGPIDLSVNHPPVPVAESRRGALQATLAALSTRSDLGGLMAYPPDTGHLAHREAGADWIGRSGLEVRPEEVVVCSGSQHAVATILATLLGPGDRVLTGVLTYPGMKAVASLLHLQLVGLPLDGDGLLPEAFDEACRRERPKALYCVPTIQNPTASVMPEERRAAIAEIARRHGVAIVEDDIHAALLPEERPRLLSSFAPELCYSITSTSKILAPGLRIGYIRAPPAAVARLAAGIRATTWAAAPLMAEVAAAWIRDGTADAILRDRRQEASARQTLAARILAGTDLRAHSLGYHLWLGLPSPWRSQPFAEKARSRGVLVTPAEAFLVGRASVPHAVRVSLGAESDRGRLERGLQLVRETLRLPMDATFQGV